MGFESGRPRPAWATTSGLLAISTGPVAEGTGDVRSLLHERLARYCWAFDERRADLLAECFATDAVWRGSVMDEAVIGPFVGDEIVGWLGAFWEQQRFQRRHLVMNFVVDELGEDVAVARAYVVLAGTSRATTRFEATGAYQLRYRREDRWRIHELVAGFDAPYWRGDLHELSEDARRLLGVRANDTAGER